MNTNTGAFPVRPEPVQQPPLAAGSGHQFIRRAA